MLSLRLILNFRNSFFLVVNIFLYFHSLVKLFHSHFAVYFFYVWARRLLLWIVGRLVVGWSSCLYCWDCSSFFAFLHVLSKHPLLRCHTFISNRHRKIAPGLHKLYIGRRWRYRRRIDSSLRHVIVTRKPNAFKIGFIVNLWKYILCRCLQSLALSTLDLTGILVEHFLAFS